MNKVFALVDCNNFFVSCERIFRPDLEKKPVMVLSNNDGCVIARSQEVKDLGIKMGIPMFMIKDIVKKHRVNIFSSNFELYGDISNRVMTILDEFSPDVEIYSIDEAFIELSSLKIKDYKALGDEIVNRIKKEIGVPVSVGIAKTKTLAKVANAYAKDQRKFNCTTDFTKLGEEELDKVLESIEVGDIWGIGYNRARLLNANGVYTAKDLKYMERSWAKSKL